MAFPGRSAGVKLYYYNVRDTIALRAFADEECALSPNHTNRDERRRHERINLHYSVTIKSPQGILSGETKNISPGGALIICVCREPLLPGEPLDLTIKRSSQSSVETSAKVVWSSIPGFRNDSLVCHIGVRFTG